MKNYGAIRKVMLILVLSILGTYCFGLDRDQKVEGNLFSYVVDVMYNACVSLGQYCQMAWQELFGKADRLIKKNKKREVEIQMVDERTNGNNAYCTDGRKDCVYNEEFFNDTWVSGKLDDDPTTHLNVDTAPMRYVKSEDIPEL